MFKPKINMCGIVGYIGEKQAWPIIIKGLKRLEYRGYDSAGVALLNQGLNIYKKTGKVAALEEEVQGKDLGGRIGIGHTRWATHGEPVDKNAHPHASADSRLAIVHNGIIENYAPLKQELIKRGHVFLSDTDTEVLIHLIGDILFKEGVDLMEAVRIALTQVVGAYAIVVVDKENPHQLVAARKGSPLVIGVGKGEYFIASDATPIIEHTRNVIYLNDFEIANIENGELLIKTVHNEIKTPYIQHLELQLEMLEKAGYDHFMLKEIYEQPRSIRDSMRGRIYPKEGFMQLGGLKEYDEKLRHAQRIIIVACGTS